MKYWIRADTRREKHLVCKRRLRLSSPRMSFLLKGLAIGFCIAAPVGPIGVLCIRRSLAEGMLIGLATGLGAATADAAYGAVAAFGLTAISDFLVGQKFWLGLIGGLFLCYLGARTFFSSGGRTSTSAAARVEPRPPEHTVNARAGGLMGAYVSTLFLTLTNPMTILSFVAIFAGFGFGSAANYVNASVLVLGVFLGSAAWWLILSTGVGLLRSRVNTTWMRAVNWLSGAIICAFGIYALTRIKTHA
jgi:threonine/homoserine/homoserine lactone efflux protein